MKESNSQAFRRGFRDGIPIGLGYLAVSFSIGIAARNIGLNAFQGFLMSLLNNASAGEYAGLTVIAANSPYIEVCNCHLDHECTLSSDELCHESAFESRPFVRTPSADEL